MPRSSIPDSRKGIAYADDQLRMYIRNDEVGTLAASPDLNRLFLLSEARPDGELMMTGQEVADLSVEANVPIERPLKLCWAAINLCNLHCEYCIDTKGTPELAAENRRRVLQNLIDSGVLSIDFTGGEPTLLPDLFDLMLMVREAGRGVTITTNGTRLDTYAPRLAELVDCVRVSVDGATGETHDLLRGRRGGFRHITRGVEALRSLAVPVRINTVVMRSNLHEVDAMTALAKSMGAEQINLIQFLPVGEGSKGAKTFEVEADAYQAAFEAAKERYEDSYFEVQQRDHSRRTGYNVVWSNGDVVASTGDLYERFGAHQIKLGNLLGDPLDEIWRRHFKPEDIYFKTERLRLGTPTVWQRPLLSSGVRSPG